METKELKKALKEFVKAYDYGYCIMVGIENKDVFIYWKHWQQLNWRQAPKVYLGKMKHGLTEAKYFYTL